MNGQKIVFGYYSNWIWATSSLWHCNSQYSNKRQASDVSNIRSILVLWALDWSLLCPSSSSSKWQLQQNHCLIPAHHFSPCSKTQKRELAIDSNFRKKAFIALSYCNHSATRYRSTTQPSQPVHQSILNTPSRTKALPLLNARTNNKLVRINRRPVVLAAFKITWTKLAVPFYI